MRSEPSGVVWMRTTSPTTGRVRRSLPAMVATSSPASVRTAANWLCTASTVARSASICWSRRLRVSRGRAGYPSQPWPPASSPGRRTRTRPPASSHASSACATRRGTRVTNAPSRGSTSAGKRTARERHRAAARPGHVRRARRVRPAPQPRTSACWSSRPYGDGVVTGHGHDRRPQGLRLLAGLHRLRRLARRGLRREDRQGHGSGAALSAARSSASTTRAAPASRRASSRSAATRRSSSATSRRRA